MKKDLICIFSAFFGAMTIESAGVGFFISAATIVLPAAYLLRREVKYIRMSELCSNPDYLIDLATRNDMED